MSADDRTASAARVMNLAYVVCGRCGRTTRIALGIAPAIVCRECGDTIEICGCGECEGVAGRRPEELDIPNTERRTNMMQIRQGDVFLTRLDDDIDISGMERVAPEDGHLVLARGEATGHIHAVPASRARLYRDVVGLLLVVDRVLRLRHGDPVKAWQGDHDDVPVDPARYRVTIDREYRPEGWDEVSD